MDENNVDVSADKFLINEFEQYFYQTLEGYTVTVADLNVVNNLVVQDQQAVEENIQKILVTYENIEDENNVAESADKFLINEFGQYFEEYVADSNVVNNQVVQDQQAVEENIQNLKDQLVTYENIGENNVAESADKFLINEFGQYLYQTLEGYVADPNVVNNQVVQDQQAVEENIKNLKDQDENPKTVEKVQKQLFKCNDCSYTTEKKQLLKQHILKHSNDRPHQCDQCGKSFKSIPALQIHSKIHKGSKPFQCDDCSATFVLSNELRRHRQYKHIKEKPHKCTRCDYACVELTKLRRHMRTHTGEKPYECKQCSYASPDAFKLQRHMRTHTGEKPYKCEICKMCFTQSNSRKKHMQLHAKDKIYFQCELCSSQYSRIDYLRVHKQKQHFSIQPIQCKLCNLVFSDQYNYKKHKKSHIGEKPYKCQICSYAVTTQNRLENHMNSKHVNKEPFACEERDKKFSKHNLLQSHRKRLHSPIVENYECSLCKKVYKFFAHFQSHMDMHNSNSQETEITLEFPGEFELESLKDNITEYSRIVDNNQQSSVLDDEIAKFGIENYFGFDENLLDDI